MRCVFSSLSFFRVGLLCLALALFVAGCTRSNERGVFDLANDRTGAVDSKGFPVVVGTKYQRPVPLKRTIERARLESELQALAEARQNSDVPVDQRRNEILQSRLKEIARTHGASAEAEIKAACSSDANGIVTCKTD